MEGSPTHREQSAAEELVNCISHGVGFGLAVAALPVLVRDSLERAGSFTHTIAVGIFALTMMVLYLSSALFHGLPTGRGKTLFGKLDNAAIYFFIAGSYSPFAVSGLHDSHGWLLLVLVWSLALMGVVVTLCNLVTHRGWSTGLYVAMGWLVLLSATSWIERVQAVGIELLVAGGVAYTVGTALFLLGSRLRFAHLGWHLFVMTGSGAHFAAVLWHS